MQVTIYCPDENFRLSGNLVSNRGVGGGKTAIVSLAGALSNLGHKVSVWGHVEEGRTGGVDYLSMKRIGSLETDLLLVTTSSKLDISDLKNLRIDATAKFLWVHGVSPVRGMEDFGWDGIVCVSHFVKSHFLGRTTLPGERYFVIHNGLDASLFKLRYRFARRDPYGIVYASHPVKGLDRVIQIVNSLRKSLAGRFHLDVYGGPKLWGEDQPELALNGDSVKYRGLLPQPALIKRLFSYTFMVNLYDIPEGFGLIYPQAMKAGVICIVSNVGGVSEVIRDGGNGFLVHNPCYADSAGRDVERIVAYLLDNPGTMARVRRNAMQYNRTWKDVARDFLNLFQSGRIAGAKEA